MPASKTVSAAAVVMETRVKLSPPCLDFLWLTKENKMWLTTGKPCKLAESINILDIKNSVV